jgi:ABC-type uncharacterized transport system substrate-binding protein
MMAIRGSRARSITSAIAMAILLLAGRGLAQAQRASTAPRIGFLSYFGCAKSLAPDGAFRQGLAALGYIEGRGLAVECRDAPGQVERLVDLAAELVRLKVDVLVTEATPASLAAKRATTTMPIVFSRSPIRLREASSPAWRARAATSRAFLSSLCWRSYQRSSSYSEKSPHTLPAQPF